MTTLGQYPRIRTAEIAAKSMDGEVVAINISTGVYYSLEGVAGRIWGYFESGWDVDGVTRALAAEYGVAETRVRSDLETFLNSLVAEGLVELQAEGASTPVPGHSPGSYATPQLNVYRDMTDLMALDPPLPGADPVPWHDPVRGNSGSVN